ncbi:hypothetical protein VQE80_15170, partial [Staphylococcus shinii]|uniref:hypothetical protein n=1 Tax=Staphylococcus shinii TaxID=2912228 RepID=UPI003F47A7D4
VMIACVPAVLMFVVITRRVVMLHGKGQRTGQAERASADRAVETSGFMVDRNVQGACHAFVDGDTPVSGVLRHGLLPSGELFNEQAGLCND